MNLTGFFRKALEKTQTILRGGFQAKLPEEILVELEDRLILADAGPHTASRVTEEIRKRCPKTPEEVRQHLMEILLKNFSGNGVPVFSDAPPSVWFLFGTNGSGKTTTAAKLAGHYRSHGKKLSLVAADTFRAAAIDQLRVWAGRAGVEIFSMEEGAQPAAVIFDALSDKKIRNSDLVIVDTAGRLHTKSSLLEELTKMAKSCEKSAPGALVERLLVLDGTAGQNTLPQAKTFHAALQLTGLVVTKLDASSKAGFLLTLGTELPDVPVKWVGMGEALEDIAPFNAQAFVRGLIGNPEEP